MTERSAFLKIAVAGTGALLAIAAITACSNATPPSSASSTAATSSSTAPTSSANTSTSADAPSASAQATSTVGNLVAGFPSQLLPLMPGAQVKQSAFDQAKEPAGASLVGTIDVPAADIVAFYTKAFNDQGFTLLPGDAVGSVVSKDFVRNDGKEAINLSVTTEGATSTFTLGANVAQASLK